MRVEIVAQLVVAIFFFFNDTATTEIYTLSLHDALPISPAGAAGSRRLCAAAGQRAADVNPPAPPDAADRKSTRLNSSHGSISYAVFCLKKKKKTKATKTQQQTTTNKLQPN